MIRVFIFSLLFINKCHCQKHTISQSFEFQFEGNTLNGILNFPQSEDTKGLVLIVHGSGQTNAVAQEWYLDVRNSINRAGYATYMWDKMGCGKSDGVFNYNQSVENSASEVIAAINYLKRKAILGSNNIGLWGISRSGWIIPIVISQYKGIEFWISVSGVDDKENFKYLFEENLKIDGVPKDSIIILSNELTQGYRITHSGKSFKTYMDSTKNLRLNTFFKRFNNGKEVTEEGYYEFQKKFMKEQFDKEKNLQVYIKDFELLLSNISCPVLALFGENDKHVDWQKTQLLYKKTLGKNTDLTIKSFPDCNHNLFKCKTGGFYEFQDNNLPWGRCDGFLETMTNWLRDKQ